MRMIRPGFLSSADCLELEACVRRQREDHGITRRVNAILLLDDGDSCARIAKFLYLDDDTIRGWHKTYLQDGWDALAFDGRKGGQSRMTPVQEVALCACLEARFCRSTVEIRAHVAAECGLNYSHSGCIKLLARLGFEYRKPKSLPRVASAQMQTALIAFYERLMRELPADEAV
jgi:transposase